MEGQFFELLQAVIAGETGVVSRMLSSNPELARERVAEGATRQHVSEYFFTSIAHYSNTGDTALHMAAAAFERPAAELLIRSGGRRRPKRSRQERRGAASSRRADARI
jgi:ankyrin repeat protein